MRILLTILLLAFSATAEEPKGFKFEFKDGTVVYGKVFSDRWYSPNPKGISIQTMDKKIYIHHYPYSYKNAPTYYSPSLDTIAIQQPYGVPSCSPTRISFMHFKNSTLKSLYTSYSRINNREYVAISKSILSSMNKKGYSNKKEIPTPEKSKEWNRRIRAEYGLLLRYGTGITYGGDINDRKYINK